MGDVSALIKDSGTQLQVWNKHGFGHVQSQLRIAQ